MARHTLTTARHAFCQVPREAGWRWGLRSPEGLTAAWAIATGPGNSFWGRRHERPGMRAERGSAEADRDAHFATHPSWRARSLTIIN